MTIFLELLLVTKRKRTNTDNDEILEGTIAEVPLAMQLNVATERPIGSESRFGTVFSVEILNC